MKNLAIIPARSGSKRLRDKNIIDLNGKPLIYYTIKSALDSCCFEEVMVSTDSEKYANIAKQCGAKVPFLRSEEMSSDCAATWDTVREVLSYYKAKSINFEHVTVLQPTSPLRNKNDIIGVFRLLDKVKANNVVTVSEVEHPVQWCFKLPENGLMDEMAKSPYNYMKRQDLEPYYRENGAVYVINAKKIMDPKYDFYSDRCFAYIMPLTRSIDIDTKMDLLLASICMKDIKNV